MKKPLQSFNPITGVDPNQQPGMQKNAAAFYGATPPPSQGILPGMEQPGEPMQYRAGPGNAQQYGGMPSEDVAAFYGVTPTAAAGQQQAAFDYGDMDRDMRAFYGVTPQ